MWYNKAYRRHLCDMHIEDWDDRFLSEFSPEEYVENLKIANIQNAMVYTQSHAGHCYYPTKTGHMHGAFAGKEDMMRKVFDLCHENNIKVTSYYSLIYNTWAHDVHEDWRMLTSDKISKRGGGSAAGQDLSFTAADRRYGLCCLNNPEYNDFVLRQIDEILEYFDSDAMFFDMPFWPHTCYCKHCADRWEKEVGGDIPMEPDTANDDYIILMNKKYEWMGKWVQSITDYIKSKRPDMPVEYNFAQGIAGDSQNGCGEEVNAASDYAGGDLYGSIYNQSFTCKFYKNITNNQPFEYMFSRCKPALRTHTLTKSADEMKSAVMLTAAHHGATLVIDAIDPVGTMDSRVYEQLKDVFESEVMYEPYFKGDMVEDIGMYYGIRSKFNAQGEPYNSITGAVGVTQTFIKNNIPFGVTGSFHELDKYKLIVAPALSESESKDNGRIIEYVKNGGNLYISGAGNKELVETLTGGKITGRTEENPVYIAPNREYENMFGGFNKKYPLPFDGTAPILEISDKTGVAASITLPYTKPDDIRFASIHSDPPGIPTDIPAVIIKKYGKGTVIWSAVCLESEIMGEYQEIFCNLLFSVVDRDSLSFSSNAQHDVEITVFKDTDSVYVNAVALAEDVKAPYVHAFDVCVKCGRAPESVIRVSDGQEIPFEYDGKEVKFTVDHLDIFEMFKIDQ